MNDHGEAPREESPKENACVTVTHDEAAKGIKLPTSKIPVEKLVPNDYNPNRMSDDEFAELVAEVRHIGRLPKPVIVRPSGDTYQIVDGEHGWRAAKEVGLEEIPCEVIEVDDFEAMRQTYKRNQHGTHDPVLQGRMFRRMKEDRGLSNRELAKKMEVSEGTIRNSILWADAAEVRNRYAPGEDSRFEKLGVRELRLMMKLPKALANRWVDTGVDMKAIDWLEEKTEDIWYEAPHGEKEVTVSDILQRMLDAGFGKFFERGRFLDCCKRAWEFYSWQEEIASVIPDVAEYLKPLVDLNLPLDVLNYVSFQAHPGESPPFSVPIPVDDWDHIVRDCCKRASSAKERGAMLAASVRVCLKRLGIDPSDLEDPRVIEAAVTIKDAPAYIRDADYLSYFERAYLHTRKGTDHVPEDLVAEAKERTCEVMHQRHRFLTGQEACLQGGDDAARQQYLDMWRARDIGDVYLECLSEIGQRRAIEERDKFFGDHEALVKKMVEVSKRPHVMREGTIAGRPALEVFEERMRGMELPELLLLASYVLGEEAMGIDGHNQWLRALGGVVNRPDEETGA